MSKSPGELLRGSDDETLAPLAMLRDEFDLLPPAKLGAVKSLLEVLAEDKEELTDADHAAIQAGLDSLDKNSGVPMENCWPA
jgi:hypothetical protein